MKEYNIASIPGDGIGKEVVPEGLKVLKDAAEKLKPEGGYIRELDVEEAQASRARRRQDNDVRFMEDEEGSFDDTAEDDADSQTEQEQTNEATFGRSDVGREIETETRIFKDNYQPAKGVYDNTEARRADWEKVSKDEDIDWNLPFYAAMQSSMLKTATAKQIAVPDEEVTIEINVDGTYRIEITSGPDTQKIITEDGRSVSKGEFIEIAIRKAKSSRPELRTWEIKDPDGKKWVSLNPVDLTNAGRRLLAAVNNQNFTEGGTVESQRQGLMYMLGELQMAGYELQIDGQPVNEIINALENPKTKNKVPGAKTTVAFGDGGKKISLDRLFRPRVAGGQGASEADQIVGPNPDRSGQQRKPVENIATDESAYTTGTYLTPQYERDLMFSMLGSMVRYAMDENIGLDSILGAIWLFVTTLQAREASVPEGETDISLLRDEILNHIR